ncbi:hypothetical protein AB0D04_07920 [Streptomyces sp. NPDC048483]
MPPRPAPPPGGETAPETVKTISLRIVGYTYPGKDVPALDDISMPCM